MIGPQLGSEFRKDWRKGMCEQSMFGGSGDGTPTSHGSVDPAYVCE